MAGWFIKQQQENNVYFWQKMDTLLFSGTLTIDRPKGTKHFQYPNLIYPVDYGYLTDTLGSDQTPVNVFRGSLYSQSVDAITVSADILKKDCQVKLLVGCTEEETLQILHFLNQTEFQKGILVRRGDDTPSWAYSD